MERYYFQKRQHYLRKAIKWHLIYLVNRKVDFVFSVFNVSLAAISPCYSSKYWIKLGLDGKCGLGEPLRSWGFPHQQMAWFPRNGVAPQEQLFKTDGNSAVKKNC